MPEIITLTIEQQAIVDGLIECQQHLGLTNEKFCTDWIRTYTESVWVKIKNKTYEAKNLTKVFAELGTALTSIRRRIARIEAGKTGAKFYEFDTFKALFVAVEECLQKKGQNRLIFFAAPTGCGKSRFVAELEARQNTVALNASEAWHGSYYFAALDVLVALGRSGKYGSAGEAGREMIEAMKGRVGVLAIDEGNYFGPRSINLVKDILNKTEWTVVICLQPADLDKMKRYYTEWSQLNRRVHAVFRHQPFSKDQIREVLIDLGLNGDSGPASLTLAKSANEFGGMDFVARVAERLESQVTGVHPSVGDVEAAIAFVKKQLDLVS